MIVEKLERIDYDPLALRLMPAKRSLLVENEVDRYVRDWLSKRELAPFCAFGCPNKYLATSQLDDGAIEVDIQWLCVECMNVLFRALEVRFGNIERIRVGWSAEDAQELGPSIVIPPLVAFKERLVTFEDGRQELVAAFAMVNRAVTVDEMRGFCAATGYVTSGERQGKQDLYKDNAYLSVDTPENWGKRPARFLSHRDAVEYCSWAGYRLPNEGEYFVAALVDDIERDREWESEDALDAWSSGKVAQFSSYTLTSTHKGELIVVRNGPVIFKGPDWKEMSERLLVAEEAPEGELWVVVRR